LITILRDLLNVFPFSNTGSQPVKYQFLEFVLDGLETAAVEKRESSPSAPRLGGNKANSGRNKNVTG
jgi:hypothetical protein